MCIPPVVVLCVKLDAHVDTKMLASDCLLFIATYQKSAFWCRCVSMEKTVGAGMKNCWSGSRPNQKPVFYRLCIPGSNMTPNVSKIVIITYPIPNVDCRCL